MLDFISVLNFLGFKLENRALFMALILFYIIFNHKFDKINLKFDSKFELLSKDISHIKKDLSNHITDTNKKIDNL